MKNNNPYAELLRLIRTEGSADNPPDMELGTIKALNPFAVVLGGVAVARDIYKLANAELAAGDLVAVKRVGETTIILGKVVEVS